MANANNTGWFAAIAPGILVAATGVGAGDLLTASLGGSAVGLAILWAACAGAVLKWFLTEGIARWQMATDTTLLEGWITRLGGWIQWIFLVYLLVWSLFTGGALVTACGVAGTAIWRIGDDLATSKIVWGVTHSLIGLALVLVGGFKLFERMMSACIAVMFVAVVLTAVLIDPDWAAVARGVTGFRMPDGAMGWVLGLLGGVGGTLTLLSYGYWIREKDRRGEAGIKACRIDLALGYVMTALFGLAMVIIGSNLTLSKAPGGLANVALDLAEQLGTVLGAFGKWIFLVGFWGAVFSSLLGVWQSVPYLFADFLAIRGEAATSRAKRADGHANVTAKSRSQHHPLSEVDFSRTGAYRVYLFALALVPLPMLTLSVKTAQLIYAVFGSLFMPLLALTLLIMNNRTEWVGRRFRNGWITNLVLAGTLVFFAYVAVHTALSRLGPR